MKDIVRRRGFLATLLAFVSTKVVRGKDEAVAATSGFSVESGQDRFGKNRVIARISQLFVKVGTKDTNGNMFVIEHRHTAKGGPARHLHREQDEWWYVLEGWYVAEVGSQKYQLGPGDSLFGPRGVAHAFAFVGETVGRILIVFQPAGRMEALFDSLAGQEGFSDPSKLPEYGMERVGPPIRLVPK
jgi:mannose-6-phosphate isomerase-like protein (cupin superfamily)